MMNRTVINRWKAVAGLLSLTLGATGTFATTVSVRVADGSGANLKGQLVILRSLEGYREFGRALTDSNGEVPSWNVPTGTYQVITTDPYGLWETKIEELTISETPLKMQVSVSPVPTHGIGDVQVFGPVAELQLIDSAGKPAGEAAVFVRDSRAEYGQWYKAGSDGKLIARTFGDGSVFIVSYAGRLTRYKFNASDEANQARRAWDNCVEKQPNETAKHNLVIHLN